MSELRNAWLAALRSGEYEQGRSFLRKEEEPPSDDDGGHGRVQFCCLGVFCEVAGYERDRTAYIHEGTRMEGALSESALRELFPECTHEERIYRQGELIAQNDTGVPFEEIANLVENWLAKIGVTNE